jgi:hypothetical protein
MRNNWTVVFVIVGVLLALGIISRFYLANKILNDAKEIVTETKDTEINE